MPRHAATDAAAPSIEQQPAREPSASPLRGLARLTLAVAAQRRLRERARSVSRTAGDAPAAK